MMSVEPQQAPHLQDESEQMVNQQQVSSSNSLPSPVKQSSRNPNTCSNKICPLFKNTKYNQNSDNSLENLCPQCIKQFQKQLYCLYCKQIYFEYSDDGKEWIMCDECERWVHTQCADILVNGVTNVFNCLRCRKIEQAPTANPPRRPNNNRSAILNKVPERRKTQECMLNNFGFYWQLSPAELAQDVQKLKQYIK